MTQWIITSSLLILAVLVIRAVGRDRLSGGLRYALWGLVLLRLLWPYSIGESVLSVQNLPDAAEDVAHQVTAQRVQNADDGAIVVPHEEYADVMTEIENETTDTTITSETIQTDETTQTTAPAVQRPVTTPTAPKARLGDILPMVWGAGMVLVGLVFLMSNVRFWLRLRRSRRLLMTQTVPVYQSAAVETPCLFGFPRPAVYVTPEVAGDTLALRHVLAHELTHYRHLDHIWSILRCVAVTVHWYNPLVWAAAFLSQKDAELACDEGALKRLNHGERVGYAKTLLDLTCVGARGMLTTATSMTGSENDLKARVLRIVKNPKMTVTAMAVVVVIAALASVMLFTGAKETETLNGVWRSEAVRDNFGTEYAPYVYERYAQYELQDGEGRCTVFRDGAVELSTYFTYSLRGDKLTLSVEEPPYWNPDFEAYTMTLRIRDGNLVTEAETDEEEIVYYPYALENPVFLGDGLFNVDYALSFDMGKERRADFGFDSYDAALLHLFRQAEVTVLEGARENLTSAQPEGNEGYHYILVGTELHIADGILYDESNGYQLSNMSKIEYFLSAVQWQFTEPETDGIGMKYYNQIQEDVIYVRLPLSHEYREHRYYVPGAQSEWREALQELYDNGVTEQPASIWGEYLYDHAYTGFNIVGGEEWVDVFEGGIFHFTREVEHPDGYHYYESYFATPEQAPKLTALMEYFINLYEDSYAIGIQNPDDYYGVWVLDEPVPAYGITDMLMYLNVSFWDDGIYYIPYNSRMTVKQNGELIKEDMEVGVTGEDFLMLFRDGTEYRIPHTLQDGVLTLQIDGKQLRFRRSDVTLNDFLKMSDVLLVPKNGNLTYDPILMDEAEKETFIDLILAGLAAKEETSNIIASSKTYYYLPVMNEVLDTQQVILSDMGTIHFSGEAYGLTNWDAVRVFLDTVDERYTKPVDLYPKG